MSTISYHCSECGAEAEQGTDEQGGEGALHCPDHPTDVIDSVATGEEVWLVEDGVATLIGEYEPRSPNWSDSVGGYGTDRVAVTARHASQAVFLAERYDRDKSVPGVLDGAGAAAAHAAEVRS